MEPPTGFEPARPFGTTFVEWRANPVAQRRYKNIVVAFPGLEPGRP
jgi:hypothetical protein